jgi:WD40 repeat protein
MSVAAANICQINMSEKGNEVTVNNDKFNESYFDVMAFTKVLLGDKSNSTNDNVASITNKDNSRSKHVGNKKVSTQDNNIPNNPAPTITPVITKSLFNTFIGHTRKVTTLAVSSDNCTLISGAEDGEVRWWDLWTGQCIRESKPMNKCAITNALVSGIL